MQKASLDTFGTRRTLEVGSRRFAIHDVQELERSGVGPVSKLPYSLRILLENLLRREDGETVTSDDIEALARWAEEPTRREVSYLPGRILLQDLTGVPAIVDLAAMRDAMVEEMGSDAQKIDPLLPSEMVIDHSVQVDSFGSADSLSINIEHEVERNRERYAFLRWGQTAFDSLKVVPPGTGIVHQVNLEYLGRVVMDAEGPDGPIAYPDSLVGTDSHTPMINGLGVLGWGVGGIEAEAAMVGQPISLLVPEVVGFRLTGRLPEGATATDLVLTVTRMLRDKGVVGTFVEFHGPGLKHLSVADRATLSNMTPEYGATVSIFPVDDQTLSYLEFTGRPEDRVELVEAYMKDVGLYHTDETPEPVFSDSLELDLGDVEPCIAGPTQPEQKVPLKDAKAAFSRTLEEMLDLHGGDRDQIARMADEGGEPGGPSQRNQPAAVKTVSPTDGPEIPIEIDDREATLSHGSIIIAAITSCTNTSNPSVMVGAGLVARKARELGLERKPWVKTSLAPGSKVVTEYLEEAGLMEDLEALGFNLVGYGCTTCIGNSGPLPEAVSNAIEEGDLVACSVLSGNRNFEGRIHSQSRANYLASPPLVVAYALAGRMDIDLTSEPLGETPGGEEVYLEDLWPTQEEIRDTVRRVVKTEMFHEKYGEVFEGDEHWTSLEIPEGDRYEWDDDSTYIKKPTFFEGMPDEPAPLEDITGARVLALLGDRTTTDHISPAGTIPADGPAGRYLMERGVRPFEFNSFGSRRGNHEVMMRGTFANIRLRNLLVEGVEGGYTLHPSSDEPISIFEAAMKYEEEDTPLVVIAGTNYGTGSSRDWAAKGTILLGVQAVIAESYERIHRSNLIGMGVLPLQFKEGQGRLDLGLTGFETYDIRGLTDGIGVGDELEVTATAEDGEETTFPVDVRLDTPFEVAYYRHGGILHYVLRQLRDEG